MYCRSLGIPVLDWIDDMLSLTEQLYKDCEDDVQFQSAMRAMVVVSIILFKAGYFLGLSKCSLIPERFITVTVVHKGFWYLRRGLRSTYIC